jgi:integrase
VSALPAPLSQDIDGGLPVESVDGELVGDGRLLAAGFVQSLAARPQTQRTYAGACARYLRWLEAQLRRPAEPSDLTLSSIAAYQRHLADGCDRSPATVRKERAALNTMLRWAKRQELIEPQQANLALSVALPASRPAERETPAFLSDEEYERLIMAATAARAKPGRLAALRDLAIILVLGDAGLRREEVCALDRQDFLPRRKGAKLSRLHVHGKGSRRRKVPLTPRATRAILAWEQVRREHFGQPQPSDPLFVTIGRPHVRPWRTQPKPGRRCRSALIADIVRRYAKVARIDEELAHPHILRHTFATRFVRRHTEAEEIVALQRVLGHASPKTTMVYVHVTRLSLEEHMLAVAEPRATIDEDLEDIDDG